MRWAGARAESYLADRAGYGQHHSTFLWASARPRAFPTPALQGVAILRRGIDPLGHEIVRSARQIGEAPAALYRVSAMALAQRVDRLGQPAGTARLRIEQGRQIGFGGIDEPVGADPDQPEAGDAVGFALEQPV